MSTILSAEDIAAIAKQLASSDCINASLADARVKRGEARGFTCQCWMCQYKADVSRLLKHIEATMDNVPPAEGALVLARWMQGER